MLKNDQRVTAFAVHVGLHSMIFAFGSVNLNSFSICGPALVPYRPAPYRLQMAGAYVDADCFGGALTAACQGANTKANNAILVYSPYRICLK